MPKRVRREFVLLARFVVPGIPVGYKTTTYNAKYVNKDYRKYVEYKKQVQLFARAAGLELPLLATKDYPMKVRTVAFFKNGNHPDPENVNKGVRDALFYDEEKKGRSGSGKGDDKHTGGSFEPPLYDKENPHVVVIVKEPKDGKKQAEPRKERPKRSGKKSPAKARAKRARTHPKRN